MHTPQTTHQKERKETAFPSLTMCNLSSDYRLRQSSHGVAWAPYTWQPFGFQGRESQSGTESSQVPQAQAFSIVVKDMPKRFTP